MLALPLSEDLLFIDDLDARQVAEEKYRTMAAAPAHKGTLGILVELYQKKPLSMCTGKQNLKRYKDAMTSRYVLNSARN